MTAQPCGTSKNSTTTILALPPGPALDHEHDVFRDYKVDFAELERRREKVVERGRTQQ